MADHSSAYHTLPTVVAPTVGESKTRNLMLSIIFHPEPGRIGESALIEKLALGTTHVLGRQSPYFGKGSASVQPLDDRYVSRDAIHLRSLRGAVVIGRGSASSRAQIDGRELTGELQLDHARLDIGVSIVLGGRVVLLLRRVEQQLSTTGSYIDGASSMCGSSPYMQTLRQQIVRFASTDLDLLICGETGTGKELVAEAVHTASGRRESKMQAVNMAAIPVSLAPSVLFGSAKGAFSGADKATVGYFGLADGGTLFLDEVGDTPPEIQAQLLRALQQREVQAVGGPIRKVNLRVISATDAALDEQSCNFKAALRHRLGESEIALLPLREHLEDIGELLWMFLEKNMTSLRREHLLPGEHSTAIEVARWANIFYRFTAYAWPGNIRQLENFAQQVALASEERAIVPDVVLAQLSRCDSTAGDKAILAHDSGFLQPREISDQTFRSSLESAHYEVARAARLLSVSRQSVYRFIDQAPDLCLASELKHEKIKAAMESCGGDTAAAAMQLKVSCSALRARLRVFPETLAG